MNKLIKVDIESQVDDLKSFFDTENIVNSSTVEVLTDEEFDAIAYTLKNERDDGTIIISKDVQLDLRNCTATLLDYNNE